MPAQPESAAAAMSASAAKGLELLEDVDDAKGLENQQHDEHDSGEREDRAAGRLAVEIVGELLELVVGQGRDTLVDESAVDAVLLEGLADLVACEHRVDARDRC